MESEGWKNSVKGSYQKWRYSPVHKDIKNYFTVVQKSKLGQPFKKDSGPLMADLSKLKEDVERAKAEDKVIKKREGSSVEFFGEKIEVGDADDEEVDKFCKDTVFNGFWKTITKLNNSVYLSTKSVGDVLKKLIKKLCDFMECGMMK